MRFAGASGSERCSFKTMSQLRDSEVLVVRSGSSTLEAMFDLAGVVHLLCPSAPDAISERQL